MIAVDTNILVAAHREELAKHAAAHARLRELAEGEEPWALPVFVLGEFVRVVTHPRVFDPPTPVEEALGNLEALLAAPSVHVLSPEARYWPLFRRTVAEAEARGNHAFDAQITALCREHGVERILTEDRDFTRFSSIRVVHLD